MNIAVLVFNFFRNDARVEKAIAAYREAGHRVMVVALDDGSAPAADVVRIELRPHLVLRARPDARVLQGRYLRLKALVDRRCRYAYAWILERRVLNVFRMGAAVFTGAALWWRWRTRAPRGGLAALLRFADRIRGYHAFARQAARALQRAGFRADLVHANDFNTLFAAELLQARDGAPFIYDAHELWVGRNRGAAETHPFEAGWELENERRIARKALRVVTVSPSIGRYLADALSVPEPVLVRNVPYARNAQRAQRGLRSILGLPPHARLLVYTGKATYNRGIEDVVDAFTLLPSEFHFVVVGSFDPIFKAGIIDPRIARHGLQGRFHQHGPVPSEEVPHWVAEGDLCLVPIKGAACLSYEYCLPNKLFEGIQAGLPVIATNLVDMKRTLDEYQCGVTYESGNAADLRDKILHILTSPGVAETMRRHAAAAARQLNWETEKVRLLELLESMPRA